ncbi:MAG: hypothetical protein ACI90V_008901, partial [Bacillariaceae sp.]
SPYSSSPPSISPRQTLDEMQKVMNNAMRRKLGCRCGRMIIMIRSLYLSN